MAITKINTPELFDLGTTNSSLRLPSGDTASRPTNPNTGELRYNTDDNYVEYWDGSEWFQIDYETVVAPCTTDTVQILDGTPFESIATYQLDGNANDLTGNYNGTWGGTEAYGTGVFGQAAVFNGSSSYIQNSSLIRSAEYSISVWFKTDTAAGERMAIGWNWSGTRRFAIGVKDGGIKYQNGNSGWLTILSSVSTNTWYNVIITSDSNQYNAYLDGNKIAAASGTGSTPASTVGYGLNLGRFGSNAGYWDGSIDQVRIYNKALSANNVATLYNETVATASTNITFDAPSLVAYYKMSDATDQTGSYDGTPSNVNFNVAGKFGNAGEFNGSSSSISLPTSIKPSNSIMSISLWASNNSTARKSIFYLEYNNSNAFLALENNSYTDSTALSVLYNNAAIITPAGSTLPTDGSWHHIVVTASATEVKLYKNGSQIGSTASITVNTNALTEAHIGVRHYNNDLYWDGKIDQVRIFNRAITANEVETLYDEVQCIPTIVPTNNFNVNTYVGNGATQTIDAKFNEAANFNGSSSYIDTTYTVPAVSTQSISVWFKTTSTGVNKIIYADSPSNGAAVNTRLSLMIQSDNNFRLLTGNNSSYWLDGTISALSYLDGNWHNVVVTYSGTTFKLYVDSSLLNTYTSTISFGTAGNQSLILGKAGLNNVNYWNGSIDQVRIFNTALTGPQVTDLYTNETDATAQLLNFPVGAGCIAAYKLDGNADDISGLYSGTPTDVGYTGMEFAPDLVWIKNRTTAGYEHFWWDSVRGAGGNKDINSDSTNYEGQENTSAYGYLSSFDSNGFTITSGTTNAVTINKSSDNYVAWSWKAADTTTTIAANTVGNTIASDVRANTDAGFSIVKYTANATSGATIGHGLDQELDLLIVKSTNLGQAWNVYVKYVTDTSSKYLRLNESFSIADLITVNPRFIPNNFTDSVFSVGNDNATNGISGTDQYIAYCFHSVDGYSKIGSYLGNTTILPSVNLGFRPAFVIIKSSTSTSNWTMWDNVRPPDPATQNNYILNANLSNQEAISSGNILNFTSTGFDIEIGGSAINSSGQTYIFMAFAEEVFVPLTRNAIDPFGDGNELALYKFEDNATNSEDSVTASASNVTYATGYIDKAAVFNNSSSEIVAPNSLLPSSGGFAISWWQKTTQADNTYSYTMDNSGGSAQNGIYIITHRTDVGFIVGFKNGSIFQPSIPYSSAERTQWTHFCVSWDGTTSTNAFKIYKNNVATSFTSSVTNGGGSYPFKIGRSQTGSAWFGGLIDQVRIFDRALDSGEVTQLYNE